MKPPGLFKRLISTAGTESSMRFMAIVVIVNIMAVWTVVSLKNLAIADIPVGVLWMAAIAIGGKVTQRFAERGDETDAGKGGENAG